MAEEENAMFSNLRVFTDKTYKKMKKLIEEKDDHNLQDIKRAFKAHDKYVSPIASESSYTSTLHLPFPSISFTLTHAHLSLSLFTTIVKP
jgi:hypothetical protein